MKIRLIGAVISLAAGAALASSALAQQPDPGHPRINQVDDRVDHQENSAEHAGKNGNLTPGQAARDEKRDQAIQNQEARQAAKNGGHLTKTEQRKDDRELNKEKRREERQKRRDKIKERKEQRKEEHKPQ